MSDHNPSFFVGIFKAQADYSRIGQTTFEPFLLGNYMLKAFKYRIYPDKEQREMFAKHFGCTRWFYNHALNLKIEAYRKDKTNLSRYDLQALLPELKKKFDWLKEVSARSLQMCLIPLESAYKRFFREKNGFPKFKSKHGKQSFHVYASTKIDWEHNRISIPKIKNIKIKLSRKFEGNIKQVTISKTTTSELPPTMSVASQKELAEISEGLSQP